MTGMSEMKLPWVPRARRRSIDDPFFEEGNILCSAVVKQIPLEDEELENRRVLSEFVCHIPNCKKTFDAISSYETHYNTAHRNVCSDCHRSFPTSHLLDVHILESHDTMFDLLAAKQKMYMCLVEACQEKFSTAGDRKDHLVKQHKYPSSFRFHRSAPNRCKTKPERSRKNRTMEVDPVTEPSPAGSVSDQGEAMQTEQSIKPRKFIYKVPQNICFGHGASRGFTRKPKNQGKKKKHWHQKNNQGDSTVDIQDVNMSDLSAALEENS